MKRTSMRVVLVLLGILLGACSSERAVELQVQLVTSLVPGPEFQSVETTLLSPRSLGTRAFDVRDFAELRAQRGSNYNAGRGIASFRVVPGTYQVRVRLLVDGADALATQTANVVVSDNYVLRVHITRDCVRVDCPGDGAAEQTACLHGQCVNPGCSNEHRELCPEIAFCDATSSCNSASPCASSECLDGFCVEQPIEDACSDLEWCNPDAPSGCVPIVPIPPNLMCGTVCVTPGNSCRFGYWNCDSATPYCDALTNRPAGTPCGEVAECNGNGSCVMDTHTPGLILLPNAELETSEGGDAATFAVLLRTQPSANVVIAIASSDMSEGTVAPTMLTFTSLNWDAPQLVTVSGVDDSLSDGDQAYDALIHVLASEDAGYAALEDRSMHVVNLDDEVPNITVSPTGGLVTNEAGGSAAFSIVLNSAPTSNVSIALSTDLPSEGSVAPTSVTFTPENWADAQTVTVTGVDDFIVDGARVYHVITDPTLSDDDAYNDVNPADVSLINEDNDALGVVVSPTSGLTTSEAGGEATFTVVLVSQPTADVSFPLSSSDASEGVVSPSSLTFTASNWSTPQIVTVTGVDDEAPDGNVLYSIVTGVATSTDSVYNSTNPSDITLTNTDDDDAIVLVTPSAGLVTNEGGGTAVFTIALGTQPGADVTITIASNDVSEGTVSPSSLTFTTGNWNTPQTVTITGVDDALLDGSVAYSIVTGSASSADAAYNGLSVDDVTVSNADNDSAGVTVSPTSGLITSESRTTATFTVVLTIQPLANVTISLASSDTSEGTVAPASLTFTTGNWNVAQIVTVTGVDDTVSDGDVAYTIITGAAASVDASYNGLTVPDVSVTNREVTVQDAYIKASSVDMADYFGTRVALSEDGNTLVASAMFEDSNAAGINGNEWNNSASSAGAVYVFTRSGLTWTQQAYIKASNPEANDRFGTALALSADGNTLIVGGGGESSSARGFNGEQNDNSAPSSGAAYIFTRSGTTWSQQAYVKASNTDQSDNFGEAFAISADGNTIAAGCANEQSNATGINGNQFNESANYAGSVYLLVRSGGVWSQEAYIKASNTDGSDYFGASVALSANGDTLAVGALGEQSNATGVAGNQADNSAFLAGAAYVFTRSGTTWSQQAYIKASNTGGFDQFGETAALSDDGNTLAIGSRNEASASPGVNGNQADESASGAGAVYVFTRTGSVWSQQAYIKASNPDTLDYFGSEGIDLSADGNVLAVGAQSEQSNATGINGNQSDDSLTSAGAVYVFTRVGAVWSQRDYIKASNAGANDYFGVGVALSADAATLAVGASGEGSASTGVNGNQTDNSRMNAGAVYVFSTR